MRIFNVMLAVVVMVLAMANESQADNNPSLFGNVPSGVTWATTMPSIELSHRPLEDVLKEIKQKIPAFEYHLERINMDHNYPILPEMKLENASLQTFADFLVKQFPDIQQSQGVDSDGHTPVLGFLIRPEDAPPQLVRVFALEDLISYRASQIPTGSQRDRENQATNDILSLIQAANDLSNENTQPVMKVHAATHTLLFKGTKSQYEITANALAALQPADDSHSLRGAFSTVVAENRELKEQLDKLKGATTQPVGRDATTGPLSTPR